MSKAQIAKALTIISQTVPFLVITAAFIGIAYTYGHSLEVFNSGASFDMAGLCSTHLS